MSTEIFRDDFVKYKNVKSLMSVDLRGGRKNKRFHILSTDDLEKSDIDKYSLGCEITDLKPTGFFVPVFPKFDPELTGEHGQRTIISLIGPSGCGKSTLASRLAKQWAKANKNNEGGQVIIISPRTDNKELRGMKPQIINCVDREKIQKNFIDDETRVRFLNDDGSCDFENSLLIVDDIEGIVAQNKKELDTIHRNIISDIIVPCLIHGRHSNCSLIYVKHQSDLNSPFSRLVQSESHYVGLFPRLGDHRKITYMMKNHLLLPPPYIKRVLSINPYYALFSVRFPGYTVCERQLIKPQ